MRFIGGVYAVLLAALLSMFGALAQAQTILTQQAALAGQPAIGDEPGFPITIRVPGSYELGSDLVFGVQENSKDVIELFASHVTLNLNDFRIDVSQKTDVTAILGINEDVTIENGTILAYYYAIYSFSAGKFWVIRNVRVEGGAANFEDGAIIAGNTLTNTHVNCFGSCLISGNTAFGTRIFGGGSAFANVVIGTDSGLQNSPANGQHTGYGANALFKNSFPLQGTFVPMDPNAWADR